MGKNFYISDLHFGHANILRFDNRPFNIVEEMNETMIKRWNSMVTNNDMVYILGDFCWGKEDEWLRLVPLLNGQKTLILGNHDLKNMSVRLKKMFADIKDYKEIDDNGIHVIMSHYPLLCYKHSFDPYTIMLHGHTHNRTQEEIWVEHWRKDLWNAPDFKGKNLGNIINVGCMMSYINYFPKTIDELIQLLNDIKQGKIKLEGDYQ